VNSTYKDAACRYYIKANSSKPIEELYFTNKKETCLNHLKNCRHFREEVGEMEYQRIINLNNPSSNSITLNEEEIVSIRDGK
jgi:hypothetical protein